jgi:hypothetical protein
MERACGTVSKTVSADELSRPSYNAQTFRMLKECQGRLPTSTSVVERQVSKSSNTAFSGFTETQ